jgi:hypothetical protein
MTWQVWLLIWLAAVTLIILFLKGADWDDDE